jgi:hypothetical protein
MLEHWSPIYLHEHGRILKRSRTIRQSWMRSQANMNKYEGYACFIFSEKNEQDYVRRQKGVSQKC